ncbi:hypothetical protein HBN50_02325 [Halobacteriovorax sp. GB3]|uniref:ImmA/IrrE family metallo-endopeptidase n=1 Tax=Halobacteriovorax sp. GB3 TaxID=2719615 RepID=UPI00235EC45C|nr:hypothetical protein [Halobacteriovorax sp. GB3]MDD0851909.1 hypothetical protein [Halobacteriovorax sp. GB3]
MKWIVLIISLFHGLALACPFCVEEKSDPSRYMIDQNAQIQSHLGRETFEQVATEVYNLYEEEFKNQNRPTKLNLFWDVPYFSAWAVQEDGQDLQHESFSINFWGGMARIPGMTEKGWAFTACHEIGHILAGMPRTELDTMRWASSEGQADYFAAAQCLKRYYLQKDLDKDLPGALPPLILDLCHRFHQTDKMKRVCEHVAEAALSFAHVLYYIFPDDGLASLTNPSHQHVERTIINSYPDIQCRIDTILSGALCDKDPLSKDWICEKNQGFRPNCWFNSF